MPDLHLRVGEGDGFGGALGPGVHVDVGYLVVEVLRPAPQEG
jgi:hypothetical protein